MVKHTSAHFTCTIATLDNNGIFLDDVKPFSEVISSLDEIYCVYPTGWFVDVYVKDTDFIATIGLNGNDRVFPSFQFNPRKSKVIKCNPPKKEVKG